MDERWEGQRRVWADAGRQGSSLKSVVLVMKKVGQCRRKEVRRWLLVHRAGRTPLLVTGRCEGAGRRVLQEHIE